MPDPAPSPDTNALLTRIATMEAELSSLRRPKEPSFDPHAFSQAFTQDPLGAMKRAGIPADHVTRVLVAHALGDQAPPELRALAQMGPQISAQNALGTQLEDLRRQVSQLNEQRTRESLRSSFQTLISDKQKYPTLSAALAVDREAFAPDLDGHKGTAAEFADALETKLSKLATALRPPGSVNPETTTASPQVRPAIGTSIAEVPPLPKEPVGAWSDSDHARVRDEVIRKYESRT